MGAPALSKLAALSLLCGSAVLSCKKEQPSGTVAATASSEAPVVSRDERRASDEVPFIENDYERALERAKATQKPIFVEAWAPWCHSCLSMRSFVMSDPKVLARAGDVVWLALDVDRKENEAILKRLAPPALPSLYRLDESGAITSTWIGSMTADEVVRFVSTPGLEKTFSAKMIDLYEERKFDLCIQNVTEALAKKPLPSSDLLGAVTTGTGCAIASKKGDALRKLSKDLARLADDFSYAVIADDRSGAFDMLVSALGELKDESARLDEARHWVIFLEEEAKNAKTPKERVVFDSHRLVAYTEVNDLKKAVTMLEASERDFPTDYNPPARLARALLGMGRVDEASAAIDRALSRGYGPRKLRLYDLKADIADAKKDVPSAKATLDEAATYAKGMTLSPNYQKFVGGLAARRKKLG